MARLTIFPVTIAAALLAACSRDTTAPTAVTPVSANVTVAPLPGATSVSRTAPVAVTFNYAMDSASAADRFTMQRGDTSGMMVPGSMRWDSTYRHMTFVPDSTMAPGTPYYVTMRDSMMTRDSVAGSMGGGMGGMGGGGQTMPGSPMMFTQPPAGATRTSGGMRWSFTTGT